MNVIRYDDVVTLENIRDAYSILRKNTEHKEKLLRFEMFYFSNIFSIEQTLKNRSYVHGAYHLFLIREPKYRLIMSEGLSDKVVNHLVSKYVLQPTIYPSLISSNVATRKGKGTKAAIGYFKYYVNKLKKEKKDIYVLKCDISKYFYSIDHEILLQMIKKLPIDDDLYDLIEKIISSTNDTSVNKIITECVEREKNRIKDASLIQELNRIPFYLENKGLPIGNMTSQILALLYLNGLDHYIKEELGISYYLRYMDDFILFSTDQDYLKFCLKKIQNYLEKELKLKLNKKTQIINLKNGVVFLGYRFLLKENRLVMLPSSKNRNRIKKKLRKLHDSNLEVYNRSKASYKGYFMGSNLYYYKNLINSIENEKIGL